MSGHVSAVVLLSSGLFNALLIILPPVILTQNNLSDKIITVEVKIVYSYFVLFSDCLSTIN